MVRNSHILQLASASRLDVVMSNLQVITPVLSAAQEKAVRKLSLRGNDSAQQIADKLIASVIKGRFKAVTMTVAEDAATKFDSAVAGGFQPPMERAEYIKKSVAEYNEILSDL